MYISTYICKCVCMNLILYIMCLPVHTLFNAHTYICTFMYVYLINHTHTYANIPDLLSSSLCCLLCLLLLRISFLFLFFVYFVIIATSAATATLTALPAALLLFRLWPPFFLYLSLRCRLLLLLFILCVGNFVAVCATISYLYSII